MIQPQWHYKKLKIKQQRFKPLIQIETQLERTLLTQVESRDEWLHPERLSLAKKKPIWNYTIQKVLENRMFVLEITTEFLLPRKLYFIKV